MKTLTFVSLRQLLRALTLTLLGAMLMSSAAWGQGTVKPAVSVLGELELPPIDSAGSAFLQLMPPAHLDGAERGHYRGHFLLTPNTNIFPFVVDASSSTGSNSTPLTFQWSYFVGNDSDGEFFPLAGPSTSPYFTNDSPNLINSREMVLDVSNGAMSDTLWFGVVTLTPQMGTEAMIEWIDAHYPKPTSRAQRRLLPPLREASTHFAASETSAAKEALGLFLRRLKLSRLPLTRHEVRVFKVFSQDIVDTATD